MSAFGQFTSGLPPEADMTGTVGFLPLLTQSGHRPAFIGSGREAPREAHLEAKRVAVQSSNSLSVAVHTLLA